VSESHAKPKGKVWILSANGQIFALRGSILSSVWKQTT
jgi:hypothetical protein